jgi:putative protein kinase ArgK-like GTPase of G3E family
MFDSLSQILSNLSDVKAILGIGTASGIALSAVGIAPKVGVGRSLILALKSTLSFKSTPSARKVDMKILSQNLNTLSDGTYILVTGGKGFGKSCLIQTALHRKFGVIFTTASSSV